MSKREKLSFAVKSSYHYLHEWQKRLIMSYLFRKQIRNKIKKLPQLKNAERDKEYLKKCKKYLKENFSGYHDTRWHHYFSTVTGRKEFGFIPNEIYFNHIEPALNKYDLVRAYTDKTAYDIFLPDVELPKTLFKLFNGRFYNSDHVFVATDKVIEELQAMDSTLFVKPAIFSGSGKNIVACTPHEFIDLFLNRNQFTTGSFVIQEKIEQHEEMAKWHPESVNTCRIMTARVDNKIVVLSAFFRMGLHHSVIDNASAGGIFCSINEKGETADFAITHLLEKFPVHPDSNLKFSGFRIPNYETIKDLCFKNHRRFLRFTLISWDVALKKDGTPIFIEYNLFKQSIHGHQIINGPIFGKYTDYFIRRYHEEEEKGSYYY